MGPIGIAAVYDATLATRQVGDRTIWIVCSFVVAASILVHGATATWLTLRCGRAEAGDTPDRP